MCRNKRPVILFIFSVLLFSAGIRAQTTPEQYRQIRMAREAEESRNRQAQQEQEKERQKKANQVNKNQEEETVVPIASSGKYWMTGPEKNMRKRVAIGDKYGFINLSGEEVIPVIYEKAEDFSEGLAAVRLKGKWGYIDNDGKTVIPFQYNSATSFKGGSAKVIGENMELEIGKDGNSYKAPEVLYTTVYSEGLAVSYNSEHKYGYAAEPYGEVKNSIPYLFDSAAKFQRGRAAVKKDGKWGFINIYGEVVIPFKYDAVFSGFFDHLAPVQTGGKWGYIDRDGKVVIPMIYDSVYWFSGGNASVKIGRKWGSIDRAGKIIVPAKYKKEIWWSCGMAPVLDDKNKYGFYDETGKQLTPCIYDDIANVYLEDNNSTYRGFLKGNWVYLTNNIKYVKELDKYEKHIFDREHNAVKLNGKWGVLDQSGQQVIISPRYDSLILGHKYYGVLQGAKWGFVNVWGDVILAPQYDLILSSFNYKREMKAFCVLVVVNGMQFYVDEKGLQIGQKTTYSPDSQ